MEGRSWERVEEGGVGFGEDLGAGFVVDFAATFGEGLEVEVDLGVEGEWVEVEEGCDLGVLDEGVGRVGRGVEVALGRGVGGLGGGIEGLGEGMSFW